MTLTAALRHSNGVMCAFLRCARVAMVTRRRWTDAGAVREGRGHVWRCALTHTVGTTCDQNVSLFQLIK